LTLQKTDTLAVLRADIGQHRRELGLHHNFSPPHAGMIETVSEVAGGLRPS
jgi:hypothetical protein